MFHHRYSGRVLASPVEFVQLPTIGAITPDIVIRRDDDLGPELQKLVGDSAMFLSEERLVLISEGRAAMSVERATLTTTIALLPGFPDDRFEALFLDWAMPYLLTLSGQIVLHATGSRIGAEIYGFAAPSRTGKSTLAVALARRGHPLVADDTFVIDMKATPTMVLPSHPGARLRSRSAEHFGLHFDPESRRSTQVEPGSLPTSDSPATLGGIFLVEPADPAADVTIARAGAFDLRPLMEQMYVMLAELGSMADHATELISDGLVYRLAIPRDLDRLPEVVDVIVDYCLDD